MCTGHLQLVFKVCNVFLRPFLSIIREPRLYQNQFLRGHALNTEYNFSEIFSHSSNTFLEMVFKVRYMCKNLLFYYTKRADFFSISYPPAFPWCRILLLYIFVLSYLYISHYLVDQLLWVHFAKKIGCIALLIQYLQVTCAWHIRDTKKSRREIETNWWKDEKGFKSRKTVKRSVKWLKKTERVLMMHDKSMCRY